jgi:hypothetical protein
MPRKKSLFKGTALFLVPPPNTWSRINKDENLSDLNYSLPKVEGFPVLVESALKLTLSFQSCFVLIVRTLHVSRIDKAS